MSESMSTPQTGATVLEGRVWVFGDDIDTDGILPARYMITTDPKELAEHCMEDVDPEFPGRVRPGDFIVAGKNFGCGSSREHAPIAIKAAGVSAVIAGSFARIFSRNAINIGLPILEAPGVADRLQDGDTIRVDVAKGEITFKESGETVQASPLPEFIQGIIAAGGLVPYVLAQQGKGD